MLWRDVLTLVKIKTGNDADGYTVETEKKTEVFTNKKSVKRSEFYAAQQTGTAIVITFEVRGADYEDEERVEYLHKGASKPTVYSVVRTFSENGEIIELNCALEALPGSIERKGAGIR